VLLLLLLLRVGVASTRQDVEQTLRVSRNSCELLGEMLGPIRGAGDASGLQETFIMDLVDQCYRWGWFWYAGVRCLIC
jgi:hypothetical protein